MQRLLLVLLLCPLTVAAQSTLNDLDGDGCVGATDILVILGQYGECNDTTAAFACGDSVLFDSYWYETVLIGEQCWFAENLRTTVYTNGDLIPTGLTEGEWISTTEGATAVHGEGSSNCLNDSQDFDACDEDQSLAVYGRLYNWHAVEDARGLCPVGWHVSTDQEWFSLENYLASLGFETIEGQALKSTAGWGCIVTDDFSLVSANGLNSVSFSAFPGGVRLGSDGGFYTAGSTGFWWSSTGAGGGTAWNRYLNREDLDIKRWYNDVQDGHSVRCIKGE